MNASLHPTRRSTSTSAAGLSLRLLPAGEFVMGDDTGRADELPRPSRLDRRRLRRPPAGDLTCGRDFSPPPDMPPLLAR
ncbi:MAG: hypothetical protein U0531_16980 [Dehalococcoidia bacterium]